MVNNFYFKMRLELFLKLRYLRKISQKYTQKEKDVDVHNISLIAIQCVLEEIEF
jgi:hypothetical protein